MVKKVVLILTLFMINTVSANTTADIVYTFNDDFVVNILDYYPGQGAHLIDNKVWKSNTVPASLSDNITYYDSSGKKAGGTAFISIFNPDDISYNRSIAITLNGLNFSEHITDFIVFNGSIYFSIVSTYVAIQFMKADINGSIDLIAESDTTLSDGLIVMNNRVYSYRGFKDYLKIYPINEDLSLEDGIEVLKGESYWSEQPPTHVSVHENTMYVYYDERTARGGKGKSIDFSSKLLLVNTSSLNSFGKISDLHFDTEDILRSLYIYKDQLYYVFDKEIYSIPIHNISTFDETEYNPVYLILIIIPMIRKYRQKRVYYSS